MIRFAITLFIAGVLSFSPAYGQKKPVIPRGLPDTVQNRLVAAQQHYDSLRMHELLVETFAQAPGVDTERKQDAVRRIINIEAAALRELITKTMATHFTTDEIYADLEFRLSPHGNSMLRKQVMYHFAIGQRASEFGRMLEEKYGKN